MAYKKPDKPFLNLLGDSEAGAIHEEEEQLPENSITLFPVVEINVARKIKKEDLSMIDIDLQNHTRMQDSIFNLNKNQKFDVKDLTKNMKEYFPSELFDESTRKKRKRKFCKVFYPLISK
jgi:hypothetical protein